MTVNLNSVNLAKVTFGGSNISCFTTNKTAAADSFTSQNVRFAGEDKVAKNLLNKLKKTDLDKNKDECTQMILELSQSSNNDVLKGTAKVLCSLLYFHDPTNLDVLVPAIVNLSESNDKNVLDSTSSALWKIFNTHGTRLKNPDALIPAILNLSDKYDQMSLNNVASALNKILTEYDLENPNALIPAVFNISKECDGFYISQDVSSAFKSITSKLPKLSHEIVRSESFQKLIPTLIDAAKNLVSLNKQDNNVAKNIKEGLSSLHTILTKGSKEKEEVTKLRKIVAKNELDMAQQLYNHEIELINSEHNT